MKTALFEKRFVTDKGTVHYWVSHADENKQWLVFLHGLTADHRLFNKQLKTLGEKYNCFVWDCPAHFKSRPFELNFSLPQVAEYLHSILEKENITSPVLIGQSLGGYIAQVYMQSFPNHAVGFVSVDSAPMKRNFYSNAELTFMEHTKWMYMSIPWKMLIKWGSDGNSTSAYGRSLMRKMMECYEKEEYCTLADYYFRILCEEINANKPYDIKCPTLLLCGEKDFTGSVKKYNRSWTKQDGYKLIWIANAGHNSNGDCPQEVNRIIDEFVSALK